MATSKTRTRKSRSARSGAATRAPKRRAKNPPSKLAKPKTAAADGPHLEFTVGDRVHVKMGAPAEYRGQSGEIVGAPEAARYDVLLDDGPTVPLHSWWLEKV
jgi:hypothetical protein